jgi:hypothetical protein
MAVIFYLVDPLWRLNELECVKHQGRHLEQTNHSMSCCYVTISIITIIIVIRDFSWNFCLRPGFYLVQVNEIACRYYNNVTDPWGILSLTMLCITLQCLNLCTPYRKWERIYRMFSLLFLKMALFFLEKEVLSDIITPLLSHRCQDKSCSRSYSLDVSSYLGGFACL